MANTYTQLYAHIIFWVKNREPLITPALEERLHKYITGIIKNLGQKPLAINGDAFHIHIFIGFKPDKSLSDIVRDIKSFSSKFVNENKLIQGKFYWQEGFGAFTYSHSQIDTVIKYIKNQKEHHKKKTFQEEYKEFLKKFKIEYNEKYVF
ncbi:MAG: IS200/IS605 family transposase [Ignavibacteriales bacterium]|nr:IS200/IS605 family transposase [Ignavibacteriales bacterium]